MSAFFDSEKIVNLQNSNLVIDTNILTSCSSDEEYLDIFLKTFDSCNLLIDPIVKLEFLRTAYTYSLFEKKKQFLEYNNFYDMIDHSDIYKKVYENAFNVARIYSHNGNPNIPLGDLLIISRLMNYGDHYFLTLDKSDFATVLFDRIGVVSIERETKSTARKHIIIEHIIILKFNKEKYNDCLSKLPKGEV